MERERWPIVLLKLVHIHERDLYLDVYTILNRIKLKLYTNGTKILWDFNIFADIKEWSKIKIYVDIYVI